MAVDHGSTTFYDAHYNRGMLHNKLGLFSQAVKDFDTAIELNPKNASAFYKRGLTFNELGNPSRAIEYYKMAARLGFKAAQDTLRAKGVSW